MNKSYYPYEEILNFELKNLGLQNDAQQEGLLKIQLEPFSEYLVFLKRIEEDKNFSYKAFSNYKYFK